MLSTLQMVNLGLRALMELGIVVALPTNEAGTGLGNQVAVYANVVWSTYVAISTASVAVMFKRAK